MDERRVSDERFRIDISQRLAAIETSQKLYHAEIKSIIENIFTEANEMKRQLNTLHYTIYGGPGADNVGLLERFRSLLMKAGIYTTIAVTAMTFLFKLFGPAISHFVLRIIEK